MSAEKNCLIIDDSEVIRELSIRIVRELDVQAEGVATAGEGVEYCSNTKTDIVFLDWDLPSMGALDFLRGIAEIDESQRPEIVLCATENDPQQFTLAKAAGAKFYLLKPYDKDSIAAKLVEVGVIKGTAETAPQTAVNS